MRRLAICFAIVAAANTSRAAELERVSLQGLLEGSSLGDLDGDGRSEIIALLRDGSAADATWSNGSVVALDAKGAVLWERKGDQYLSGGLSAADFDGDGQGEVAYCEASASGTCMVVDGDGELLWQTPSAYYPGISGVAPASADLTHDGAQDLVTNSWGGTIAAYDGPTGFELWHFDAYTELGELFHSNPTLFDLNGDHTHDVILVGSQKGYVVALDGVDGHLLWKTDAFAQKYGNYARGNGVLVTELRAGKGEELMIAMRGATSNDSAVFGVARDGSLLFREPIPGFLSYMSAVAADVDGDAAAEIFVQSRNGVLYRLDRGGKVAASTVIGTESWVAPSFVDADGDGVADVVASSTTGVKVLKGMQMTVIEQLDAIGDGLQPSPVVADVERDGRAEFFMGSWYGTDLLRIQLQSKSWSRWDTLGGSNEHLGQLPVTRYPKEQPVVGLSVLSDDVARLGSGLSRAARRNAERAVAQLASALELWTLGRTSSAINALQSAERHLRNLGAVAGEQRAQLGQTAVELALQARARLGAIYTSDHRDLVKSDEYIAAAQEQLASGDVKDGLAELRQAFSRMERVRGSVDNYCFNVTPVEPYLALQCELLSAVAELQPTQGLAREVAKLGVAALPLLNLAEASAQFANAIALLPPNDRAAAAMVQTLRKLTRLYLDDRQLATGTASSAAEQAYLAGLEYLETQEGRAAAAQFARAVHFSAR